MLPPAGPPPMIAMSKSGTEKTPSGDSGETGETWGLGYGRASRCVHRNEGAFRRCRGTRLLLPRGGLARLLAVADLRCDMPVQVGQLRELPALLDLVSGHPAMVDRREQRE